MKFIFSIDEFRYVWISVGMSVATLEMMNYTFQTSNDENMKGDIWVTGMKLGYLP